MTETSSEVLRCAIGKAIISVEMWKRSFTDELRIQFADGSLIRIMDDGQDCCEKRYMVCDDDLPSFVNSELRGVEINDAPEIPDGDGEVHEVQFLVIHTSKGDITCSNHNEHNGYYGGFNIVVENVIETGSQAAKP